MPPIQLIGIILAACVVLGAFFMLIAEIYFVFIGHWKGAPFVKSSKERIKTMLELAAPKPGMRVIDLGSGDGALLLEAARQGAIGIGLEINPFLVWYSRFRVRRAGLQYMITILHQDFRAYLLKDADVILCYLLPQTLEKLKQKLSNELKSGARIVSNDFPIQGWPAILERSGIYLYQK